MRTSLLVAALLAAAFALPAISGTSHPTPAPGFVTYGAPGFFPESGNAGEPSIGINWSSGSVFFQSYTQTYRAKFNDSTPVPTVTWANVGAGLQTLFNVDPILVTDHTTGQTFAGGLDGECSVLGVTTDDGATWQPVGNACASPSFDHETIGVGPWAPFPQVPQITTRGVYYCTQYNIAQCAVSHDGGLTFGPAIPVQCGGFLPGLHGSVHVAPDGVVYLPFKRCGNVNGVSVSVNNGLSWFSRPIPGAGSSPGGFDPDVASTPSGWAYVGYSRSDYGVGVALTKNHGANWINFGDVAASAGIRSSAFHEMVAGDDDRVAVAYLGSTTDGDPFNVAFNGTWDVYVTYSFNANATVPTWTTVKATDDPVQRGWICAGGVGCGSGRNLLDFIDAQVDAEGRVLVGFADGCIAACALPTGTAAMSTSAYATIARQTCGDSLFAAVGALNGGAACPTVTAPSPVNLTGTYYATGVAPVGNVDALLTIALPAASETLTPTAPTGLVPKLFSNAVALGGANAGSLYDAHWFMTAPAGGFALNGQDVVVDLWVIGGGVGTLRIAIFDANSGTFAPTYPAVAQMNVTMPLAPTPTLVTVTLPNVTAVFGQGFELFVSAAGVGEPVALYDSALTPTRVTFV